MRKYLISAVSELFTFIAVIVLLWNFTKMDTVEILWVDLFLTYCSGFLTFIKIEEREKKKCRIKKYTYQEYLKASLHSAMKFARKSFMKGGSL